MKRTIALLLVLAMTVFGLFATAETQSLKVVASVGSISNIRIVSSDATNLQYNSDLAAFNAIPALAANFSTPITEALTTIAKLNFYSKQIAPFTATLNVKSMASLSTGNDYTIRYVTTVGTSNPISVTSTDSGADLIIPLKPATIGTSLAGSLPISVDANDSDWAAAPVGNYIGTLTFSFISM